MRQGQELQMRGRYPTEANHPMEAPRVFTPATDIFETADNFMLHVDMPGVSEKDVNVTLENDVLTIRGRVEPEQPANMKPAYREYDVGDYRRVFTLSSEVDRDRIEASVKDGVLRLVLPKAETAKARRIAVRAA